MKHKFLSYFTAFLTGLSVITASGFISEKSVVKAVNQQQSGNVDGYDYELWNQDYQGTVDMQVESNGLFSFSWSDIEDCVFRIGKKLENKKSYHDNGSIVIDYDVDYQPITGISYVCVYGHNTNLHAENTEYYIVEAWGDWRPPGESLSMGTVSSDGKEYDIYKTVRYGQPSIFGIKKTDQYWSVQKTNPAQVNEMNNLKGTVTVLNHFRQWEKAGIEVRDISPITLSIECYRSSGIINVKKNDIIINEPPIEGTTGTATPDAPGVEGSTSAVTTPAVTTPSASVTLNGDTDENGSVTAADVVKLMQFMTGKTTLSDQGESNSDLNDDGTISIIDLILLKNLIIE